MLRIFQQNSVAGAQSYYSTADYYTEGQEIAGRWRGKAAERLGLSGEIQKKDWDALCANQNPATGERLTKYTRSDRRVGYDLNWHVPKSVSLLYAHTGDERLVDAVRDAVQETMQDIESEVQTRVRKGRSNHDRTTGNLVWGEFIHTTGRPVNGVPDPHLHVHAFAMNVTYDEQEQGWKAIQLGNVKADGKYFEQAFHVRLAKKLGDFGLETERTRSGWMLKGVEMSALKKFSRRTALIEAEARRRGIYDVEQKAELGAKTREKKETPHSYGQLQSIWDGMLTDEERESLRAVAARIGSGPVQFNDKDAPDAAIAYATKHVFERKAVVRERVMLAHALQHAVGSADLNDVLDAARRADLLRGDVDGRSMISTPQVLAEEQSMLTFARSGRGTHQPFAPPDRPLHYEFLSRDQRDAVAQVLASTDGVTLFRGIAGSGKTTAMQEIVAAIQASGSHVHAFAPSAEASRVVLREAGFENADTIAKLLQDPERQRELDGGVIWIDEAGLVGTPTMAKVFELAERHQTRVLLSGDARQHASVERGSPLHLLEREAGLRVATLKDIRRQKGAYKAAVAALADGRVAEGFQRLDDLGWIEEIDPEHRYRRLAHDYASALKDGKTALVISPTHAEGDRTTREIREVLGDAGVLDRAQERSVDVLISGQLTEAQRSDRTNYSPGDVLVFHRSVKGIRAGAKVEIGPDGRLGDREIPLDLASRFDVYQRERMPVAPGEVVRITKNGKSIDGHTLDNGTFHRIEKFDRAGNLVTDKGWTIARDFGHLAPGYVTTSVASQGKSRQRVFLAQSSHAVGASSIRQFYVSASRGTESVRIFTDDKAGLLDAVKHDENELSATELMTRARQRRSRAIERANEKRQDRQPLQQKRELVHER
jgi:conjugative relaxase-like TrwC/TraI family protein